MSRSYQHHSLRNKFKEAYWAYVCYFSNKKSKQMANQKFRSRCKQILRNGFDEEVDHMPTKVKELTDVWDFSSDGLANHHYIDTEKWGDDLHKLTGK